MTQFILVLDEGTTSTRAMLFTHDGRPAGLAARPVTQHYPAPGEVEHDADEIWAGTLACAQEMVDAAGGAGNIAAIGITNQRETVVAWDRMTGEPIGNALVWQDRRTADRCADLRAAGHEEAIQSKTGLLLDPYFSATKMEWMLANRPAVRAAGDRLAFGTVESWLIWKLTGGAVHATDASNASRTMLMTLEGGDWDEELCDLFGIDPASLPRIVDCAGAIGQTDAALFGRAIPICGAAGDQQAATIGQGCLKPGHTKATFGTGAFVLTNSGERPMRSSNRMLATVLCQIGGRRSYALEGSIFVAGSLMQWLRDSVGLLVSAAESEDLARSVADNGGVYMVPALSGLGAPHWQAEARGLIRGISFATTRAHIVRAALEAQAHQIHDLMTAFEADGVRWERLRIDGGMVANDWLAQDLADMLDIPVERPASIETTALGAAMLASVGAGIHPDLETAAAAMDSSVTLFSAKLESKERSRRLAGWRHALSLV
ncbi:glycerol kinase GlpK [Sphingomonas sp. G124]|uniref:Glycerol kinase GlpK n=1 Tax=Sphingomonas cremea TaxID=2904799 RepID=A0A9X1QL74_9SPHN|nr:glycerol kinase GlpK [Sphingomonas cremea]MCF2515758.1 glycerol kinase GlpK [Sphingomonas cremea]